jgi:GGDEF domain-containing protein
MLTGLALLAPVVAGVSAIERGRTAGVMAAVLWTIAVVALVVARGSVARRQEVAAQRDVRSRATIDPPTGALRREAFLEQASGRGVRDRVGTVLMIHVGFDWIPDVERPGDEVMAIMVERFHQWLSGGPLVARLGDDEFAVFVRSSDTGRGRLLGESLRAACSEPVEVGGQIVVPVLSVGVAQIDGTVIDLVAGLRRSGRALRHALESGFLRVAVDAELIGDPSVPQVGSAQR